MLLLRFAYAPRQDRRDGGEEEAWVQEAGGMGVDGVIRTLVTRVFTQTMLQSIYMRES